MINKTYRFIKIFISCLLFVFSVQFYAQESNTVYNQFLMNIELRPRIEYTSNYFLPPNDSIDPYFYTTQRNRISMSYTAEKWLIKSDVQEIHIWEEQSLKSKIGSINFYQLYFETKFKFLNVRIGRQSILLDNGRLFSDAPWAQQGRAHEGIRLMKTSKHFSNDFFFLFTRNYGKEFDPVYSPVASNRYKYLMVNNFNYNFDNGISINSLNVVDLFKDSNSGNTYGRATSGGRIELKTAQWYYTLNSYLQFGRTAQGKKLFAYYFQPEIKLSLKSSVWRLGAEIISGNSSQLTANESQSFDVLYGVTWKFNGNMNVFTRFPADVGAKGLINPYLFALFPLNSKFSVRSDFHLFYTQFPLKDNSAQDVNKFLGFENDLSLKYVPIKQLEINYAFSFYSSTDTMQYLPKIQNENKLAFWSYLMVSYSFNAVNTKR